MSVPLTVPEVLGENAVIMEQLPPPETRLFPTQLSVVIVNPLPEIVAACKLAVPMLEFEIVNVLLPEAPVGTEP